MREFFSQPYSLESLLRPFSFRFWSEDRKSLGHWILRAYSSSGAVDGVFSSFSGGFYASFLFRKFSS